MSNEQVEVYLERKTSTPDAILFTDGDSDIWIPKSVITDSERIKSSRNYKITIPEWFAIKEEIV